MDAHHRFERRSLRDVLIDQGVLNTELADELMTSARENGEPFGSVVVEGGHMTAWDLAKVVATHYQMPYLPLQGFDFDKELSQGIAAATLFHHQVLPVGRFGKTVSFAVVEPPSRDCIAALQEAAETNSLFFFVGEAPDVNQLLTEHVNLVDSTGDTSWHDIFDSGDRNVLEAENVGLDEEFADEVQIMDTIGPEGDGDEPEGEDVPEASADLEEDVEKAETSEE